MATELYIEEYSSLLKDEKSELMQAPGPLLAKQKVSIGAGSAESAAFNARTKFIYISCDAACQFVIGASPQTADANSRFLAANASRWVDAPAGQVIAVIQQQ